MTVSTMYSFPHNKSLISANVRGSITDAVRLNIELEGNEIIVWTKCAAELESIIAACNEGLAFMSDNEAAKREEVPVPEVVEAATA